MEGADEAVETEAVPVAGVEDQAVEATAMALSLAPTSHVTTVTAPATTPAIVLKPSNPLKSE